MKLNALILLTILLPAFQSALFSYPATIVTPGGKRERNILATEAISVNFQEVLITDDSWNTLPGYNERSFWDNLPGKIRQEYISGAERYLDRDLPVIRATDYLEFTRSGDRQQEKFYAVNNALVALTMGELAEGKGRFIDQLINVVWIYCEQTWWGWSAHLGVQRAGAGLPDEDEPFIDLGVGEVACNLAWTLFLFREQFDKVNGLVSKRLEREIRNKVLDPYMTRNDWYTGFKGGRPNNWNPWINYNMLNCFLIVEKDPDKKREALLRIIYSLDKFLNGYPDDGGCDEGPSYWKAAGAMLYESLEMLGRITSGTFNVFNDLLVRNIGSYFYKVNIHAPYFLNFADADAAIAVNDPVVYCYGKAINDTIMQSFGAYLARSDNWGEHALHGRIRDQIRNLGLIDEIRSAPAVEALIADFRLPGTDIAGARDREGSFRGFYFGAKGGNNVESHNHNDVGSCVMYYDGKPCIIDIGREEYVAKTFSSKRYEIWTMQSGYHNVPVINGSEQEDGAAFRAHNSFFSAGSASVTYSTDISGAYPVSALVKKWKRTYTLNRGKSFIIRDDFELEEVIDKKTSSNLMTCCSVKLVKPGLLLLEGNGFAMNMTYNPKRVRPVIEFIEITDNLLKRYWPGGLTRIKLEFIKPDMKGTHSIVFTPAPGELG
jgi:hypothetical protein